MYLDFFSLEEKPFHVTPNTQFLYPSLQHQEIIDTFYFGIHDRKGFMTLTGEVGTGKTTTIRALFHKLGDVCETAYIVNPLISTTELLRAITKDFGLKVEGNLTVQFYLEVIEDFLLNQILSLDKNALVVVDEAQNLSMEALEMLRLLSNLETESKKLIQIILVGQPELDEKLQKHELRQLRQRIQIRYVLKSLNEKETQEYIIYRLLKASKTCKIKFHTKAISRIFDYTKGVPRLINSLCEIILMLAYIEDSCLVTKKMVDKAYAEWNLTFPVKNKKWLWLFKKEGHYVAAS